MKTKGRTIWTIVWKLAVLLTSFWLLIGLCFRLFPMHFFDGEYAWYAQNRDYARHHDSDCRVLILGDSQGQTAWIPAMLSEDCYNFSLISTTPIENYYCLREYLRYNEAPEAVIYTITPRFFSETASYFWTRNIYFHRLAFSDILDLNRTLCSFQNVAMFAGGGRQSFLQEALLYYSYCPIRYGQAFLKRLFSVGNEANNRAVYAETVQNRGQYYIGGNKERCDEVDEILVACDSFTADPILDYYFRKLIELCLNRGIAFIFQALPRNESTFAALSEGFVTGYEAYLESVSRAYPKARIDSRLTAYDNACFSDPTHFNVRGATRFSLEMREKYADLFDASA